jgi:iron complex transport system ATP-binding protein
LIARHSFMETVRTLARSGTTIILVTHHIEEIVPEIARVVLLRDGRVVADGSALENITAARLSGVFGHPVALHRAGGYHYARPVNGTLER